MPRFSANLGFLWPDRPLLDRIAAASDAGFRAVELHWPYDVPAEAVRSACGSRGLELLGLNTAVGDASKGDSGLAAVPGHVQIAAVPSRGEPDEGEIAYDRVLRAVDALGYQGWIGCEYHPRGKTEEGLGWLRAFGFSL